MPRKRDPRRDEAFKIWKQHDGDIANRAIAKRLDVPEKTISAWKSRDKWNAVLQSNDCSTTKKRSTPKARAPSIKEDEEPIAGSGDLTEKQRLFCLYYVKSFNATQAAIKAGYSADTAHVQGPRLLSNVRIADYVRRVKSRMHRDLFIDAMDVLNKYVQIAFADISDYVSFGRKEIDAVDDNDDPVKREINFVDFKNSSEIDGTIVTEVKQGRDGISVKLADKMKALEMLTKYFDLLPDNVRHKLEEEKLKADIGKAKAETDRLNGKGDSPGDYESDGFMDALDGKTDEVWKDD